MSEWRLQTTVATFLTRALPADAYFTSIDAGQGRMDEVQGALRKARGVKSGVGDELIVWRGMAHFIELKLATGHLSDNQKRFAAAIEFAGGSYAVCRSVEEVEAALRGWGIPLRATSLPASEYDARMAARSAVPKKVSKPRRTTDSRTVAALFRAGYYDR